MKTPKGYKAVLVQTPFLVHAELRKMASLRNQKIPEVIISLIMKEANLPVKEAKAMPPIAAMGKKSVGVEVQP